MMKVAVCIPTFNQAEFLNVAVQSSIDQVEVETEIWVADDASTDNTADVITKFANDTRVHYIRREQNLGISLNAGNLMMLPETEYIVRLDSDDFLEPGYVVTLAKQLDACPAAAVAHCSVNQVDRAGTITRRRELNRKSGFQSAEQALIASVKGYKVAANICMFRKSALPTDFIYRNGMNFCEDWDLWIRIADAGWGNVYVDRPLANYRVWTDGAGYRASRKVSELQGIETVFDVTLKEAFDRRSWDKRVLSNAKKKFASHHVISMTEINAGPEGQTDVKRALLSLSENSIVCRGKIALVEAGFGFMLVVQRHSWSKLVSWAKAGVRAFRCR